LMNLAKLTLIAQNWSYVHFITNRKQKCWCWGIA
jgi:hypothetical protein